MAAVKPLIPSNTPYSDDIISDGVTSTPAKPPRPALAT